MSRKHYFQVFDPWIRIATPIGLFITNLHKIKKNLSGDP